MMRTRFALVALTTLATTACDAGTGSPTGSGAVSEIAIDAWPAASHQAFCTFIARCPEAIGIHFATADGCKTFVAQELTGTVEIARAKAGQLVYDGKRAAQCIQGLATLACADFDNDDGPPGCDEVFRGAIADAGACESSKSCASRFCERAPGASCGKCAAQLAVDAPCPTGEGCADGLACLAGKCTAHGTVPAGGDCDYDEKLCQVGHYCADDGAGNSQCQPLLAAGAACSKPHQCAAGTCVYTQFNAKGGQCGSPLPAGAECFGLADPGKARRQCADGHVCGAPAAWDGKSKPALKCLAVKKAGEACESSWQCGLLDATCVNGTCAALPKAGEACAAVAQARLCGFGSRCDDATGKCAALPGVGVACLDDHCAEDLRCVQDKCALPAKLGEACGDFDPDKPNCEPALTCGADGTCTDQPMCK